MDYEAMMEFYDNEQPETPTPIKTGGWPIVLHIPPDVFADGGQVSTSEDRPMNTNSMWNDNKPWFKPLQS